MSSFHKRKRGAQPGNQNASKANRDAKAASLPAEPIPANIDELLDREIRLLNRLMARLEKQVDAQEAQGQEVSEEETRKTVRVISYASLATLRILRARQLLPNQEKTLQDYLDEAITELNAELKAQKHETPV